MVKSSFYSGTGTSANNIQTIESSVTAAATSETNAGNSATAAAGSAVSAATSASDQLPLSGGTMTGTLTMGDSSGTSELAISGRTLYATTANSTADNVVIKGGTNPQFVLKSDYNNVRALEFRYANSNQWSYITAPDNFSISAGGLNNTLSLSGADAMYLSAGASDLTLTASSSNIVMKTGESGSSTTRMTISDTGTTTIAGDLVVDNITIDGDDIVSDTHLTISTQNSGDINFKAAGGQTSFLGTDGSARIYIDNAATPSINFTQTPSGGAAATTKLQIVDPTAARTISLPDASDTLIGKATTDTLTNKTLSEASVSGNLLFPDNNKAVFGTGGELEVYVDSSNNSIIKGGEFGKTSYLQSGTVIIAADVSSSDNSGPTWGTGIRVYNGATELRHPTSAGVTSGVKLQTQSTGVYVNGVLTTKALTGGILKLETSDTTVEANNVLGSIQFSASDEADGTDGDARLLGASIDAVAEGVFTDTANATKLLFKTGASGAATTKMTLTSAGDLNVTGSLTSDTVVIDHITIDDDDIISDNALNITTQNNGDINIKAAGGQVRFVGTNGDARIYIDNAATPSINFTQTPSGGSAATTKLQIADPTAARTILLPDASDTLVGKATTDTLTNKTLTAPDINGGTADALTSLSLASGNATINGSVLARNLSADKVLPSTKFTADILKVAVGVATDPSAIGTWLNSNASDGFKYGDLNKSGGVTSQDSLESLKLDSGVSISAAIEDRWHDIVVPSLITQSWYAAELTAGSVKNIKVESNSAGLDVAGTVSATAITAPLITPDNLDLAAIAKDITDTAVDVFVYDTSKDSDGGAWRKRTQHTSWYNEAASATRGSRKEFPSVAVIVAEATQLTIYDGDDPDLPMWMVFNKVNILSNVGNIIHAYGTTGDRPLSAIVAKDGYLVPVESGTGGCVYKLSFIADRCEWITENATYGGFYKGNIGSRNAALGYQYYGTGAGLNTLVTFRVNDVAMTVLPNAPIDAATGLPVPTIAVGTAGGTSIIRDDGTVVDILTSNSSYTMTHSVKFKGGSLYNHFGNSNNTAYGYFYIFNTIPTADTTITINTLNASGQAPDAYGTANSNISTRTFTLLNGGDLATIQGEIEPNAAGGAKGLTLLSGDLSAEATNEVAFVTSSYNTGWQNGDIKLATLSDTSTTNVTAPSSVVSSTFIASEFEILTSSWSIGSGVASCTGADSVAYLAASNSATGFVAGDTVKITFTVSSYTSGNLSISLATGAATSGAYTATGTYTYYGKMSGNNTFYFISNSFVGTISSPVVTKLEQPDRSVNDNPLEVFGTVTKTAVATGADLVAYSGFSASNYLQQPYNSDLDFGTGDFSIMGWVKPTGFVSGQHGHIFARQDPESANEWALQYLTTNNLTFRSAGATIADAGALGASVWSNVCVVRASGTLNMYINGVLKASGAFTGDISNAADATPLRVGGRSAAYAGSWGGSLALLRISATAPTATQIAKIYEDEKHLFQAGAQATLHGTSNNVTALAHDDATDLLHVGTSAGRSVFQGLRRVENTTDAITAAISASNGLVAEE